MIVIDYQNRKPIYEQIVESIKAMIMSGELGEDTMLPSVRALARDLKISALTVKKAYDHLESEGFIVTVHGKGSFVAMANANLLAEQARKEVEADLERAIQKGRRCGMTDEEISDLVRLLMEDSIC